MSTNVNTVTNHYPSPQNGFTTTTSGSVGSGAATVGLNSVAGYTNGQIIVLVIDPTDASKKQTFTGVVDTAGVQVTGVKWTAGTNQTHALGATVVDYATATHISMITKGLLSAGLTQAGGMGAITPTSITSSGTITAANFVQTGGADSSGWTVGFGAPDTVAANGNRSYTLTYNATDKTSVVSNGMRLRTERTVSAPTQCTSLNGTNQYYSKSSPSAMTFTDDFVVSAWVKMTTYSGTKAIASRYNGTSGWSLYIDSNGAVSMVGYNAGAGNYSVVGSYQSIPLNKWVHVTAQLDMSTFTATTTTSYVMIDGVNVPASVARAGTNPTALVQPVADLQIGARNGADFFPGKIAQVAIYNAKVTQATILASMNQGLSGSETSLISAYSFNNAITDLSANANNLTANGAAVATNADSPFGTQASGLISATLDYGIIQSVTFSTNTTVVVQVPEGCTIPTSGGVSAVSYSTQKAPYGFPGQEDKWRILSFNTSQTNTLSTTFVQVTGKQITVPVGEWRLGYQVDLIANSGGAAHNDLVVKTLSTTTTTETDKLLTSMVQWYTTGLSGGTVMRETTKSTSTSTIFYLLFKAQTSIQAISGTGSDLIYAENAYL